MGKEYDTDLFLAFLFLKAIAFYLFQIEFYRKIFCLDVCICFKLFAILFFTQFFRLILCLCVYVCVRVFFATKNFFSTLLLFQLDFWN